MPPQHQRRVAKQLSHPRDRRVRQLEKQQARADRVSARELKRKQEKERMLLRMIWFREQCIALGCTRTAVPRKWWQPLVQLFISRNDEEIAALKAMRNPPVGRIRLLEHMASEEMAELGSGKGFEIPALGSGAEVEVLTEVWDGAGETVSVLAKDHVRLAAEADREGVALLRQELAVRVRPIEDVRAGAEAVLPRRARRFSGDGRARVEKGRRRMMSVKHLPAATGAERRERVRQQVLRKQWKHVEKQRRAVLEARRNDGQEDAPQP